MTAPGFWRDVVAGAWMSAVRVVALPPDAPVPLRAFPRVPVSPWAGWVVLTNLGWEEPEFHWRQLSQTPRGN